MKNFAICLLLDLIGFLFFGLCLKFMWTICVLPAFPHLPSLNFFQATTLGVVSSLFLVRLPEKEFDQKEKIGRWIDGMIALIVICALGLLVHLVQLAFG